MLCKIVEQGGVYTMRFPDCVLKRCSLQTAAGQQPVCGFDLGCMVFVLMNMQRLRRHRWLQRLVGVRERRSYALHFHLPLKPAISAAPSAARDDFISSLYHFDIISFRHYKRAQEYTVWQTPALRGWSLLLRHRVARAFHRSHARHFVFLFKRCAGSSHVRAEFG